MTTTPGTDDRPRYATPPINEVALAVQFAPDTISLPQMVQLHEAIRAEHPTSETHPGRPPMGEQFEVVTGFPPISLELVPGTPLTRFWYLSPDQALLVQVQHDLLAFNWRRRSVDAEYPGYEAVRERTRMALSAFADVLNVDGAALEPNWCEVTYLNQIEPEAGSGTRPALSRVLRNVTMPADGSQLPPLEDAQVSVRFVIPDADGEPRGRLTFALVAAIRHEDRLPVWGLSLTARLLATPGGGIDAALDALDVAHEWVGRGFNDLTSDEMHGSWRPLEGGQA